MNTERFKVMVFNSMSYIESESSIWMVAFNQYLNKFIILIMLKWLLTFHIPIIILTDESSSYVWLRQTTYRRWAHRDKDTTEGPMIGKFAGK